LQNFPNPFNPSTLIRYFLETEDEIRVKIYDRTEKLIITFVDERQVAGYHQVEWKSIKAEQHEVA
jgi:flagellar hook assembly protein FlgD